MDHRIRLSLRLQVPSGIKIPTKDNEKALCLELLERVGSSTAVEEELLEELHPGKTPKDIFEGEDVQERRDDVHLLLGAHLYLRHH